MNLILSDTEEQLVAGARRLGQAEFPRERLRALADGARPDAAWWKAVAAQGWFSLSLPEARGGAGLGVVAAALIHREVGRALLPGPLLWTHLAARHLPDDLAGDVAAGAVVVAGAVLDGSAGAVLVEDADLAGLVLLVAADGLAVAEPAQLPLEPVTSFDPTRSLARLTPPAGAGGAVPLDAVPGARRVAGPAAAADLRTEGACLAAAQAAGGAARVVELAVDYARERRQFGRAIGSFQSVKHLCVDLAVGAEAADAAVAWAALHIDQFGLAAAREPVAAAKIVAGAAFLDNARGAVQVLGAMGYTWDHDVQLYLKRAHALDVTFGGHRHQAGALGARLAGPPPTKEQT